MWAVLALGILILAGGESVNNAPLWFLLVTPGLVSLNNGR